LVWFAAWRPKYRAHLSLGKLGKGGTYPLMLGVRAAPTAVFGQP
jgi:hypothetical protein